MADMHLAEAGAWNPSQTSAADESQNPTFRTFMELWARKLESIKQQANDSRFETQEPTTPVRI